ncbi:MAG: hypothetical protein P8129_12440, partial [Anaerolineae bacterium]
MNSETRILRFSVAYRIEHWVLTLSFGLLALTGLVQSFMDYGFARQIIGFLGGIENVRLIHHLSAIVMMLQTIYHLGTVGYRMLVERQRMTMLPGKDDVVNALQALRYNLGLAKSAAREGRYTFAEKLEYWAVIWGTVVMGATGFMLWNPIATTKILPGDFVPAAKAAHAKEALLAIGMLAGVYFFVAFEETAISTVPPAEQVAVYVPLTPTPIPTPAPTLTPAPLETVPALEAETAVSWQSDIASLMDEYCVSCHGPATAMGGLDLSSYAAALAGGDSGPAVVPGEGHTSLLITRQISGDHPGQLSREQLDLVSQWIEAGAPEEPSDVALPTAMPGGTEGPAATEEVAAWESNIGSLVQEKCVSCHNDTVTMGGLDLSSYESTLEGGVYGPAVVAGDANVSQIVIVQRPGDHPGQFTDEELELMIAWIEEGAPEN